jgi:Fe-S oxidoreductase
MVTTTRNESLKTAVDTFIHEIKAADASQLDACTRCGICAEACHFYLTSDKPEYTPIWKAELLRRAYEQNYTPLGKLKVAVG